MKVALAGGGTAGHVNPLLATASAIHDLDPQAQVIAVGTAGGLEEELVPAAGERLELIPRVPFPRRPNAAMVKFPVEFRSAISAARSLIDSNGIDVVVGFGGYASTPMYLAAKKADVPYIVHEGNARPGLANRWGARNANIVALTFESTPLRSRTGRTETIGLPMRREISELAHDADRRGLRERKAREFGLDPDQPILLVTGGSSGALRLNETVVGAAREIRAAGIQVLHITGRGKDAPVRDATEDIRDTYKVLDYLTTMEDAYAVTDLAITRAGAGMVAELSALGIPAVYVPLPVGNGEQALNAKDVVSAGGALLVDNAEFTPDWVRANVLPLFSGDQLAQMSTRASSVSPLDAAQKLARLTLELAGGRR